jgi:DNA-binding HxlR family transcriptional regulator
MSKGHRWVQSQMRENNRKNIIKLLEKTPKRFGELLSESGYSPRGLSSMLKDLESEKKIERTIHDGKEAYTLTKSGKDLLRQIPSVAYILDTLDKGGVYYEEFSLVWNSMMYSRLSWGIKDSLLMDKEIDDKINPLKKEMVIELQEKLYEMIYDNVKKRKTLLNDSLDLNLVLEISIEYKELVKSIREKSLLYYKNITEKELDLCEKINNGNFTKQDAESFDKLRNKTKIKLGILKK